MKHFEKNNKIENNSSETNTKFEFNSLSPLDNIDENDEKYITYKSALDFALSNKNIYNIAITGSYGSGKSSVIDSYFKSIPCKDFLKISLATFSVNDNDKTDTDIKLIEKGILQQMFYRKAASFFPFSRFKRISSYNPIIVFFLEICLICTIIFFTMLLKPEMISKLYELINQGTYYLILFLISSIGFIFLGFNITKFFLKFRLIKFTFQKIEFGLDDVKDESLLNKYIDEILYFFEKTKYKTVVFEDLDRFKNIEIFYHLREINSLINNYEKIKYKVVFIYALRDETFENGNDRTKFFDFIIPIVPIMDIHNSKAILFKEKILDNIDEVFKIGISNFIDDRRLLKNCINEFQIYDRITDNSNDKILFSLILYKNFYPTYFPKLNERLDIFNSNEDNKNQIQTLEDYLLCNVLNKENINNISRFFYRENKENDSDNEFFRLVEITKDTPDFERKLVDKENVFVRLKKRKDLWNNYAILNNDLLDYLLENEKKDYQIDLRNFIDTMFKYDQNHPDAKFFTQYNRITNLAYFYKNINKYIIESKTDYDVFFKGLPKKILQFFLLVDDIDNNNFIDFIKREIPFINDTKDKVLYDFISIKKDNSNLKNFILNHIENNQINCLLNNFYSVIKDFNLNMELESFLTNLFQNFISL